MVFLVYINGFLSVVNINFSLYEERASELGSGRSWEGSPSRRDARLFPWSHSRKQSPGARAGNRWL